LQDDVLYEGHEKAQEYIDKKIKAIEEKRWRIVADYVKNKKVSYRRVRCEQYSPSQPVTNFSSNACHDRYQALQDGSAKPTPESEDDPSPATLARIEARRRRQLKIDADIAAKSGDGKAKANLEGNGWTSRLKDKFEL
jgi:hypothetical protein